MILEAAGASLEDVPANTCYFARQEGREGFNEVNAEYFREDRPARATLIVNFGAPDNLVEVSSTAGIST